MGSKRVEATRGITPRSSQTPISCLCRQKCKRLSLQRHGQRGALCQRCLTSKIKRGMRRGLRRRSTSRRATTRRGGRHHKMQTAMHELALHSSFHESSLKLTEDIYLSVSKGLCLYIVSAHTTGLLLLRICNNSSCKNSSRKRRKIPSVVLRHHVHESFCSKFSPVNTLCHTHTHTQTHTRTHARTHTRILSSMNHIDLSRKLTLPVFYMPARNITSSVNPMKCYLLSVLRSASCMAYVQS